MDKQVQYSQLVQKRKACRLCSELTNPSVCENGAYDKEEHIGPWTRWQGNLDAELMIIGQDWGGEDLYVTYQGIGNDENATNKTIRDLLASIEVPIELPQQAQGGSLFFTNSILCLRADGLTGPTKEGWFKNCSKVFLRPQIELVNPKVVATLGLKAYRSVLNAYGILAKSRMEDAVQEIIPLPEGNLLVPLYHPGKLGTLSRSIEEQKMDWRRVRKALDESSARS